MQKDIQNTQKNLKTPFKGRGRKTVEDIYKALLFLKEPSYAYELTNTINAMRKSNREKTLYMCHVSRCLHRLEEQGFLECFAEEMWRGSVVKRYYEITPMLVLAYEQAQEPNKCPNCGFQRFI